MTELRIQRVSFEDDHIVVNFSDTKQVRIPLTHFPRLHSATPEQRNQWSLIGRGKGIHWEAAAEDLSLENFLTAYSRSQKGEYARSP
jgi:hypothetical protein